MLACAALAVARIAATYPVFNQTWDEPAHIAAGMEWIDRGRYTYEPLHPPLARIFTAFGPRLAGIRSAGQENVWLEGNAILHAGRQYYRNLALARLGILPFFVLATLVVSCWARRLGGPVAAVFAVLLFTTLPPVLAHSGIATTDMAITATLGLAMWQTVRWLDAPTTQDAASSSASPSPPLSCPSSLPCCSSRQEPPRSPFARGSGAMARPRHLDRLTEPGGFASRTSVLCS